MPVQRVVEIGEVIPNNESSLWHIRKMAEVLQRQGQIEPLQVYREGEFLRTFEQDAWGAETVIAARALQWPTLLVLITERYIR